jgi:23S rRNA pseudouridine2605 synthase
MRNSNEKPGRKTIIKKKDERRESSPSRKPVLKKRVGQRENAPSEKPVTKRRSTKTESHELVKKSRTSRSKSTAERAPRERYEKKERTKPSYNREKPAVKRTYQRDGSKSSKRDSLHPGDGSIRLNKYIANAGICSRRDADKLIESGVVKVNGKPVTELGTKIKPGDVVQYGDQTLRGETLRYVLLNKPKGFLCTLEDPQNRRTVMELVKNACAERIYPVGRLDRNTTGLLLLTNDGDLAKKLTHPRHKVKKVYQVELDKALTKNDMVTLANGLELDDGFIAPDAIAYAGTGEDKKKVGIEIHSGRNRIVRRMFEKMGYDVVKLDRTVFANLTKKDIPRGKWRHLSVAEINILRRIQ